MAKHVLAWLLTLALMLCPGAALASPDALTAGEAADILLAAADDYNPGAARADVLGGADEDEPASRAQGLEMLGRAFGKMPELTGQNARGALPADFADLPAELSPTLQDVLGAGLVEADGQGKLNPDAPLSEAELNLWIRRAYALFGTNVRDDFYAAVNRDKLNQLVIQPGMFNAGTMYDLIDESNKQMQALLEEITSQPHEPGSTGQKIADYYQSILDVDARDAAGIEPIKPALEKIDSAQSVQELMDAQNWILSQWCKTTLLGFSLSTDFEDSTRYRLTLETFSPSMPMDSYQAESGAQAEAYKKLRTEYFAQIEPREQAERDAQLYFEFEKALSQSCLNPQDSNDVSKLNNLYTMDALQAIFHTVDLDAVLAASGYAGEAQVLVLDEGLAQALAEQLTQEQLPTLKAVAKMSILAKLGGMLNHEFTDISNAFVQEYFGLSGSSSAEEDAAMYTQNAFSAELGQLYAQRCFSAEAKADVERMVRDIMDVYRRRIQALDWLSDETKVRALRKLDTMNVKIGYPDADDSETDGLEIRSTRDGGSFFENAMAVARAAHQKEIERQGKPVDKSEWTLEPFTVNAGYEPSSNDITFPAAILQPPMYDLNASYEENLGGIGYVIAHEITHAFDNNGAKFDENGNAADWWTPEDYAAFEGLCADMAEFYDGWEGTPGIPCNGWQTLSENVADQGAAACITQIASEMDSPDFATLYRSLANVWAAACSREYALILSQTDLHSSEKLRINRVVVNCDPFYKAFGVEPGAGMYVSPEDRVHIW